MNPTPQGQSISSRNSWLSPLPALLFAGAVAFLMPNLALAQSTAEKETSSKQEKEKPNASKDSKAAGAQWSKLQGKWKSCQFGGEGSVEIKDGVIQMAFGDPMTGVRWDGKVPRENYELELEARRTDGFDFFCGLTFPVGEDCISFILGGWGGGVVGISSIDGRDASENDTTSFQNFENKKWYKVRVRVEPNKVTCWINDKVACDTERKGLEFDIRYEMDPCTPLGIAAFQCKSELRNIRIRNLPKKAPAKK